MSLSSDVLEYLVAGPIFLSLLYFFFIRPIQEGFREGLGSDFKRIPKMSPRRVKEWLLKISRINLVVVLLLSGLISWFAIGLFFELKIGLERQKAFNNKLLSEGVCLGDFKRSPSIPNGVGGWTQNTGCMTRPVSLGQFCDKFRADYERTGKVPFGGVALYEFDPLQSVQSDEYYLIRKSRNMTKVRYICLPDVMAKLGKK